MQKKYSTEEIINNRNLIFNLKNDIIFKRVFLNIDNINYLKLLISKLLNINMNDDIILLNNEIPNSKSNIKSSFSDLILKYENKEYIFEMNNNYSELLFYKNHHYLLKEHTRRNYKKNIYGKGNYTILINFDNFDFLKKNRLIYKENLTFNKYNNILYKNIEYYCINLDCLKKKYYNNIKLNDLEKLLIIFIEQRIDKILSITNNKYVRELIKYMEELKMEENFITTYDREEFEQGLKEEFERNKKKLELDTKKFKKQKIKFDNAMSKLENDKSKLENDKSKLIKEQKKFENEKIEFAKELKKFGLPITRIVELTKLSLDQIHML